AVVSADGGSMGTDGGDTGTLLSRPDGQTQAPIRCDVNNCTGALTCGVEKCSSQHFLTKVGGAAMLNSGDPYLDCISQSGVYMVQPLIATVDDYRYALSVTVRGIGAGVFTIGEIAVGGTTVVSIQADNDVVKICRPATASLP